MALPLRTRPLLDVDLPELVSITTDAFQTEAEAELILNLVRDDAFLRSFSLVAEGDGKPVGYVMFSECWVSPSDCPREHATSMIALAPLAVSPDYQRLGVGKLLIQHALKSISAQGKASILVLGDPAYYRRFGFHAASNEGIFPPFDAPDGALQVLSLPPGEPLQSGVVTYCQSFGL